MKHTLPTLASRFLGILWLVTSVCMFVSCSDDTDEAGGNFKLYYPDTGLLIASLDEEAQIDLRANKNLGVYKGALYENFVAEAFLKQGLSLYYYKKENGTLEEDFFVRTSNELVPVEVKANNNRSKSLRQLIDNSNYADIKWGIKLADSNIGIEQGVHTFPYFCTFLIKRYLAEQN